jgi:hypothetical protein
VSLDTNRKFVAYPAKIVLHCVSGSPRGLDVLVESFLADGVKLVCVVGRDAAHVEDLVDEIVVGDGSDKERFILTSSHPGESLRDTLEFAQTFTDEYGDEVQVVEV